MSLKRTPHGFARGASPVDPGDSTGSSAPWPRPGRDHAVAGSSGHGMATGGRAMRPTAESHPGSVGKYRIDGLIGQGAMGVVYLGHDEAIDRPLAIKTIRPDALVDLDREALLARFGAEARAAGRCQHPNIVTVYDYVEQAGAPYIVMEHVDAGGLDQVLRAGSALPLTQIAEIVAQLLSALGHAHEKGVVHRDVKPANILCPTATAIKVADFGVARLDGLNMTGASGVGAIGTPNYMSPEQFLGRRVDGRSDLFSAGVVLFQLLTGQRPFAAQDVPELMQKLLHDDPPSVRSVRPDAPQSLDAVVAKALARNVEDRFQSAAAFDAALAPAMAEAIATADAPSAPRLDLTELAASGRGADGGAPNRSLSMTMSEKLSASTLERLERALAQSMGPIARVALKRAAGEATDAERLLSNLASQIPSSDDAARFRTVAEAALHEDHGLAALQLDAAIPDRAIEAATEALTPALGPVAKVLARRKAAAAIGIEDYWRRLSEAIPDDRERKLFLDQLPTALGRRP